MSKRLVLLGVAGVLLVAALVACWPVYRGWQERRAVARAQVFLSSGDYRQAWLCAGQALRLNPRNVPACRALAQVAESAGDAAAALQWKRRVAALEPNLENELELAASALRIEGAPWPIASEALKRTATAGESLAGWQVLSAELAMKQGDLREAAARFEAASALDPGQRAHGLNLAVLRLTSTNETKRMAARCELEELADDPQLGAVALGWLVRDTAGHGDTPAAVRYSTRLVARRDTPLTDRLAHARLLRQFGPNDAAQVYLTTLQGSTATNAAEVHSVSAWMLEQGLSAEALNWLKNLPANRREESPVRLAVAECYAALKDWAGLEAEAEPQNWGTGEFLRRAYLARAATGLNHDTAAEGQWRLALREAWGASRAIGQTSAESAGRVMALASLARQWGWDKRRQSLLWELARKPELVPPRLGADAAGPQGWALRELEQAYSAAGDTASLARVYEMLAALEPENSVARNNLAATWLLLGMNLGRAHKLAADLFAAHPGEPVIAATWAYSLHLQGRTGDALAVLEKLGEDQRREPAVALYYGMLLRADNQPEKAAAYLSLAGTGHLLPEETRLLRASQ